MNPDDNPLASFTTEGLAQMAREYATGIENGVEYNNLNVAESAHLARECLAYIVTELHRRALENERDEQDLRHRLTMESTENLRRLADAADATAHEDDPWHFTRRVRIIRDELRRRDDRSLPVTHDRFEDQ
ncbi:hypothetical protein [Amycolatopsis anabasis]|uniref:hypothetical protein n=1 Tax=Amycolatopsis anabasis TaxID=1840409 RepID=UPI00131C6FCA|nr:hypothetical protein [Amycolatopsis anabasis]